MGSNLSRFRGWAKRLLGAISSAERTEITIQTERFLIIRRRRSSPVWCAKCGREVDMVPLSQARELAGTGQPLLPGSAEAQGWHLAEAQDGSPLVCLESLLRSG